MASLIPSFDTSMTQQAMQSQAGLLQNLGQQIRQDITTLVASRQMRGLAEGLQSVDTTSPQFGRQVAGLMSQYPLAAQSQLGQAAINQLGSEFKLNQQIAAEDRRFRNQLGGYAAKDYIENRPYGTPVTADGLYNVATGRGSSGGGAGSAPSTPYQEPPLPVADNVLAEDAAFLNGRDSAPAQPGIPAAQPQITPEVANPNAGNPPAPVAPINSVGAQIQAYDQQLRQQRVPQHLAEGMLRDYARSLTIQQRPGSVRVENTKEHGLMERGPDGVWHPAKTADGTPLGPRASGGNIENMTADNRRADASMRLREAGDLDSRANRVLKQMDQTGIGSPGPFQKKGKWYSHTDKGEKEVTATMAQRWLDLNHEYTQLRQEAQRANEAYRALTAPVPPASSGTPAAAQVFNYDPTSKLTPVQ